MSEVKTDSNAGADTTNPAVDTQQTTAAVKTEAKDILYKQDVAKDIEDPIAKDETVAKETTDSTQEVKTDVKVELKLPEGSLLDAKVIKDIELLAKEKGLNPEQAQVLLNRESAAVAAYQGNLIEQHKQITEQWIADSKADTEIGGVNFDSNVEHAKRAFDKFATPEFRKALVDTGYGNHKELIRVFARIGKLVKEDKFVQPGESPAPKRSATDILYDNTPKQNTKG